MPQGTGQLSVLPPAAWLADFSVRKAGAPEPYMSHTAALPSGNAAPELP